MELWTEGMQALRHEGIAALVQWSDACPTLTKEAAGLPDLEE
jgi:hypothetical protein